MISDKNATVTLQCSVFGMGEIKCIRDAGSTADFRILFEIQTFENLEILENFGTFGKFQNIWKIGKNLENLENIEKFGKFWNIWKILEHLEKF